MTTRIQIFMKDKLDYEPFRSAPTLQKLCAVIEDLIVAMEARNHALYKEEEYNFAEALRNPVYVANMNNPQLEEVCKRLMALDKRLPKDIDRDPLSAGTWVYVKLKAE